MLTDIDIVESIGMQVWVQTFAGPGHHSNIGIGFRATVRLWLTLSWVDYTMKIACWRRLYEFLRRTGPTP